MEVLHWDLARMKLPLGTEWAIPYSFSLPARVTINFRDSLRWRRGLTSVLEESMLWTKSNRDQYSLVVELKQALSCSLFLSMARLPKSLLNQGGFFQMLKLKQCVIKYSELEFHYCWILGTCSAVPWNLVPRSTNVAQLQMLVFGLGQFIYST